MQSFDTVPGLNGARSDTMLKSVGTLSKTAQNAGIEWTDFAKQSFAHGSETMKKLTKAKSLQAVAEIQTEYLKGSYERMVAQAKVMTALYGGLAKEMGMEMGMSKPGDGVVQPKLPAVV